MTISSEELDDLRNRVKRNKQAKKDKETTSGPCGRRSSNSYYEKNKKDLLQNKKNKINPNHPDYDKEYHDKLKLRKR